MMNKGILSVKSADLLRDSLKYMKIKCNMDDNNRTGMRGYRQCMQVWADHFSGGQMQILTGAFGREWIGQDDSRLYLEGTAYTCRLLEQSDLSAVTGGIFYLFHAQEADAGGMGQTERFYAECWEIALLDAARLWLERYLRRQQPAGRYLSGAFGPGFYGMEPEAVAPIVRALEGEQIGITLLPGGSMEPSKSLAGIFLTGTKPFHMPDGDCLSCRADSHCRMCRHFEPSGRG